MIVSRSPLRISFAGGGSDLPSFYREEPGGVVSTSIDKYIYITVNHKFDRNIRASYSVTEIVRTVGELRNELIRESLRLAGIDAGIEITSISDIPSEGTGLGSSSTYTVGLLNALHAHLGRHAGAERLAREACTIEIERCGKPIGRQDQYIAAYGGLQYLQFNPDGTVYVDPIICRTETKQRLREHLLLLYTGVTRSANDLLRQQSAEAAREGPTREATRAMVQLARDLRAGLAVDNIDRFGEILHEAWMLKRGLTAGITNPRIDDWYERARRNGAVGGKILGAGGGGFLLLWACPEHHERLIAALPELRPVAWHLEPQGSKIIYVEEDHQQWP